jgi:IS30 family transposase
MNDIIQKILTVLKPAELTTFLDEIRNELSPADFKELSELILQMEQGEEQAKAVEAKNPETKANPQTKTKETAPAEGSDDVNKIAEAFIEALKQGQQPEQIVAALQKGGVSKETLEKVLPIVKQKLSKMSDDDVDTPQRQQSQYNNNNNNSNNRSSYNRQPQGSQQGPQDGSGPGNYN